MKTKIKKLAEYVHCTQEVEINFNPYRELVKSDIKKIRNKINKENAEHMFKNMFYHKYVIYNIADNTLIAAMHSDYYSKSLDLDIDNIYTLKLDITNDALQKVYDVLYWKAIDIAKDDEILRLAKMKVNRIISTSQNGED